MKKNLHLTLFAVATILGSAFTALKAQTLEWRLINPVYSSVDPDGAGRANGSVAFTLQIHTASGTVNNINAITAGWSYDSTKAMIPNNPGCTITSKPANVVMSPAFASSSFDYTTVNQCGPFAQTAGGQSFNTRAIGTIDGNRINLTTTWTDVFTVTLWTLGSTTPEGGYVVINSGNEGNPGPFPNYSASDVDVNEYVINSLTYDTPLSLSSALPITLSGFNATCTGNGALLSWETLTEINNDHFDIEKSDNGTSGWIVEGTVKGAGNSTNRQQYQFTVSNSNNTTTYYRLKQVDKDGKSSYSSIEKTDCRTKSLPITVYPVPATDVLNIVLSSERNAKVTIKLMDVAGRVYKLEKTDVLKGRNKITLNVAKLFAGQYILRVEKDNEVQIKEILIQ